MDALQLLEDEHRQLEALFGRYEGLGTGDIEARDEFRSAIVRELVAHTEVEEQALYPILREAMPELEDEIHMDLEWHHEVEDLLGRLDDMPPDHSGFDPTIREIITKVREHVENEEESLYPKVRDAFDPETLTDLGTAMAELLRVGPTRTDPLAPGARAEEVLDGETAAALDRARASAREMDSST